MALPKYEPLKPMFPYKGSKWRLARSHLPEPQYDIVIEPFAGSGCYSLVHHRDREVILVDIDPSIASIWRFLQTLNESHYELLPDGFIRVPDHLSLSAKAFLSRWTTRGDSRPRETMCRWQKDYPDQFWNADKKQRVIEQASFIRHWNISGGDYRKLGNLEATWFIDAPYQRLPKLYPFSGLDYRELGKWAQSRLGQVIVCEGGDADWLPFKPLAPGRTRTGQPKGAVGLSEVFWHRAGVQRSIFDMGARVR